MTPSDPSTPDPSTPSPEDTWARLQRLYGEADGKAPVISREMLEPRSPEGPSSRPVQPQPPAQHLAQPQAPARPQPEPTRVLPTTPPPRNSTPQSGNQGAQRTQAAAGAGPNQLHGGGPPSQPQRPTPQRKRRGKPWYRPKLRWFVLYLPLAVLLLIGGGLLWAWSSVNDLYRVDLKGALAPVSGDTVNYLIVGSDSREGVDASQSDAAALGPDVQGRRSDTLIVLSVGPDDAKMMSIPRDLWVTNAATSKQGRINATYAAGPDNLVRTITKNLGIPINRYVEVDLMSFARMVDAMGGIEINFPNPAFDSHSGLKIESAGAQLLDGKMALAYVRSRHYVEVVDGQMKADPTADLGRQQRQQTFIRTVLNAVGDTRNPLTLAKVASAATSGVRVDQDLGMGDLISLARRLSGASPSTEVLPTTGARKGKAAVLVLKAGEAKPILQKFGAP